MPSTNSPHVGLEIEATAACRRLDGLLRAGSRHGSGSVTPSAMAGQVFCKVPPRCRASLLERLGMTMFAQIDLCDSQKGCDLPVELADDLLRSDVPSLVLN